MHEGPESPALFVTFEGGEGVGKSTLIQSFASYLRQQGKQVLVTREPGGTVLGEKVRSLLLAKTEGMTIGARAELYLFLAARIQHLEEVILPALRTGSYVLCDRFHDSTIAYQGLGRGLGMEEVQALCLQACAQVQPDVTFLLDLDPAIGLRRARGTPKAESSPGELDRIEGAADDFHELVRQGLLTLARQQPARFIVLDASLPKEEVQREAIDSFQQRFKSYGFV